MDNKPLLMDPVSASFGTGAIALIAFTFYASTIVAAFAFAGNTKRKAGDEEK